MSLHPELPETVVAIGDVETVSGEDKFVANGAGFLVSKDDKEGDTGEIFLVTNRHVLEDKEKIVARLGDEEFTITLRGDNSANWTSHQKKYVDIAVVSVPLEVLSYVKVKAFPNEDLVASTAKMKKEEIGVGSEVFVLGFPMGIAGVKKNFPIVRSGIIARFDDEILKNNHYYYIDAAIYGGNSGGPVVSKEGLYAIGVVAAVEPQWQTLYGYRNGRYEERMYLYEHANLGVVVPMEYVRQTINRLKRKMAKKDT